jgi:hypothetical protein
MATKTTFINSLVERNHLLTQIPVNGKKKLSAVTPDTYRKKLLSLCQMKDGDTQQCLEHPFLFTTVHNMFDNSPQDFFYNAISLNGNKADSKYINFSDSCAWASHPQKDEALYNSLMEFLERQALLGSWLSKTYQYTINPNILRSITPYNELVDLLLENGELYIFQNSNHLPGHTVIMFYFSQSPDDLVQYSIGSSSGLILEEALTSSFEELYQCYTFLYNVESSEGVENKEGAGYHLEFQQCNHPSIRETIPFMRDIRPYLINSVYDLQHAKQYTYQEVLTELGEISRDIYCYHAYDTSLDLHYIKILSPDFFMHVSLNNKLNIENCYAKKLKINKKNAFLGKMPFP